MIRINKKLLVLLIGFVTCFLPSHSDSKETLDQLGAQILESLQSFYPVKSTQMGIHSYDNRFTDYSSRSVGNMTKQLQEFQKKLYRFKDAKLATHDQINYKLLKSNIDVAMHDLKKVQWHKRSPQLYVDEAVDGLYALVLSNHAPLSEKVVVMINRMEAVPQLFSTARQNIKNPPPIYIEAATESLESAITFYKEVAGELMNKFPERADYILKVSTKAREGMNDFLIYLSEIQPGDEKSFALGKQDLDYKLQHEYLLSYDSDSLLKIGEALYEEANTAYHEYKNYIEEHHQNGYDSVFVPAVFTKQDIMDYYNWEVNQIKLFIEENEIISIPEDIAPVTVVETPPFLRSMIAGIAYNPAGPFDTEQQGYFYVRPIPDDLPRKALESRYRYVHRRGFKGSAVHEAYPGHHLQLQIAGKNPDPIRKWQMNLMMAEGWALYSEQMMYEQGLFGEEDPNQWLGILGGIRFRAARIIADMKLHTGQFTVQECINWMNDALDSETESSKEYIRKQVRKYTLAPTMPMTYLTGKTEILKLLDAYQAKTGVDFSLTDFHDALLTEGCIPPVLMWDIMELEQ
ncbi:MAG: DUF885 domain-containing protein [Calditrichaeota bacterium]|nr:MAG: DUF885 domain-containing protein [Calditrichota bacterium]